MKINEVTVVTKAFSTKIFKARVRVPQGQYKQLIDTTVVAKNLQMALKLLRAQYGKENIVGNPLVVQTITESTNIQIKKSKTQYDVYINGEFFESFDNKKIPLALVTRNRSLFEGLTWLGYPCTKDCSGHQAGDEWAQERDIEDPDECPLSSSNSFREGCKGRAEQSEVASDS